MLVAARGRGREAGLSSRFALDLYARLRPREGNLFFSPFSVYAALVMAYAGARNETAAQMAATLHLPQSAGVHGALGSLTRELAAGGRSKLFALSIANALWRRNGLGLIPAFSGLMREHYGAEPGEADFENDVDGACRLINDWVLERTQGRIRDLVHPHEDVKTTTQSVIVNAIYFKARWLHEFALHQTESRPFQLGPGRSVEVPTMHMEDRHQQFGFFDAGDFKLLRLYYDSRGELAMVLLAPSAIDGLTAIESRLDAELLERSMAAMKLAQVRIDLPRFGIEARYQLKPELSAMGMPVAFQDAADFSAMTLDAPVKIGDVIHQSFVAVDEHGTEAAAATAVVDEIGAMFDPTEPQWVDFRADRPFLFLIRHVPSKELLFVGRVTNPLGG